MGYIRRYQGQHAFTFWAVFALWRRTTPKPYGPQYRRSSVSGGGHCGQRIHFQISMGKRGEDILNNSPKWLIALSKSVSFLIPPASNRTWTISNIPRSLSGGGSRTLYISKLKLAGRVHAGGYCWSDISKPTICVCG